MFTAPLGLVLLQAIVFGVRVQAAESHTVRFDNRCGYGNPQLIKGGNVLTNSSYTSNGMLDNAIAYLQTGSTCLFNGENCSLIELTLVNPTVSGGGSSADLSLIDPHAFNVATRIEFFGGCDNIATTCSRKGCKTAFYHPDDTWVQIACQEDNVNLLITFCPDGSPTTSTGHHIDSTTSMTQTTSPKAASAAITDANSAPVCKHKHAERRSLYHHRRTHRGGAAH
ncbi:hypothetical protein C8J57DRAFT_1284255 [Mycena rebaudengoi]|nr:hypothetical protein C8J57DRAFT_1284255 [Mycena rebaudengoi]